LLLGKFGKLPLGFPADWVYQSAFGDDWQKALEERTEASPLDSLPPTNFEAEEKACADILKRQPTEEELIMYLNHPGDAIKTMQFNMTYGNPNCLPVSVWFEGLDVGEEFHFVDSDQKPHTMVLLSMSQPDESGIALVRYVLDSEIMTHQVQVAKPDAQSAIEAAMADPKNPYHVGAPSSGDLWVMYVRVGDIVEEGDELFNVAIMKQEKAILSPMRAMVKRVVKTANYKETRKMVSVRGGELIIELAPVPTVCSNEACGKYLPMENIKYCPHCGTVIQKTKAPAK